MNFVIHKVQQRLWLMYQVGQVDRSTQVSAKAKTRNHCVGLICLYGHY